MYGLFLLVASPDLADDGRRYRHNQAQALQALITAGNQIFFDPHSP